MADDRLILEHLRGLRASMDRLNDRMDDVVTRLSSVEQQVAGLRSDFVSYSHRTDTLEKRLERVERRLELHDDA